jgi:hypothetical protein
MSSGSFSLMLIHSKEEATLFPSVWFPMKTKAEVEQMRRYCIGALWRLFLTSPVFYPARDKGKRVL